MSNKNQLQTNNTTLASLIQTLQGKAAGGGGSSGGVETCTLTIVESDFPLPPLPSDSDWLVATDGNMNPIRIDPVTGGEYKIAKNTLLFFRSTFIEFTGSYEAIFEEAPFVVRVMGDCSFEMLG